MTEKDKGRILQSGAELVGAGAGMAAEVAWAGVLLPGSGGVIAATVTSLLKEIQARQPSARESRRVVAVAQRAHDRIGARLLAGDAVRADGFFDNLEQSSGLELLEGVLLKARDEYEERKLPFLANYYANVAFDEGVSPENAHLLLRCLQRLSFRQVCILRVIGATETIDVEALRKPDHDDPELDGLKREEMDLHESDLGSLGLVTGQGPWTDKLNSLGLRLYELAGLAEIAIEGTEELALALTSATFGRRGAGL